jgi:hypothetical protein
VQEKKGASLMFCGFVRSITRCHIQRLHMLPHPPMQVEGKVDWRLLCSALSAKREGWQFLTDCIRATRSLLTRRTLTQLHYHHQLRPLLLLQHPLFLPLASQQLLSLLLLLPRPQTRLRLLPPLRLCKLMEHRECPSECLQSKQGCVFAALHG